jgi:hypothetical protein
MSTDTASAAPKCAACRDVKTIGEPPAPCPFCRLFRISSDGIAPDPRDAAVAALRRLLDVVHQRHYGVGLTAVEGAKRAARAALAALDAQQAQGV